MKSKDARSQKEENLRPISIDKSVEVAIFGIENSPEFRGVFFKYMPEMDTKKMEAVQKASRLPVFDLVVLTHLMYETVCWKPLPEHFDEKEGFI